MTVLWMRQNCIQLLLTHPNTYKYLREEEYKMKMIKTVTALMLTALFISCTAMAEGQKLADKLSNTVVAVDIEIPGCNADAAKLCPGLPLNSKKSFMCLMAYEDNLSTECKLGILEAAITLEASMLAIDYSIQACEADADKFCLDVEPGEGRLVSCLRKNESKLKKECTTALKETGLWELGTK
jgi:hypothetical protein